MFLNTTNGDFTLIDGVTISLQTPFSQLRAAFPENKIWEVGTGYCWIYFSDMLYDEKKFAVEVCYHGERLKVIHFTMQECDTPWQEWSEAHQIATEQVYKHWLTAQLGEERRYDWGNVDAYFDRRSALTYMYVYYN